MKFLIFMVVFAVTFINYNLANRVGDEKPTIYSAGPTADRSVSQVAKESEVITRPDTTKMTKSSGLESESTAKEELAETESEKQTSDDENESGNANQNHDSGKSGEQQFELELESFAEEELEETEGEETTEGETADNEDRLALTSTKLGKSSQNDDSGEYGEVGESGDQQFGNKENNDGLYVKGNRKDFELKNKEDAVANFIITSVEENLNIRFRKIQY